MGVKVIPHTVDVSGQPLKSHEAGPKGHILIGQEDKTKGIITTDHILTSSKINYITKKPNITIDSDNYTKSGKPQRVAELETGRIFPKSDEGITYEKVPDATKYLQKSDIKPQVEAIIANSPPST